MLTHIHIKNVAVIEDLSVDLKEGMSVLTGETGAGKSIIIDSINLILGARTNKGLVRYGEKKAQVQAVFDINDNTACILKEKGIDTEDNQLIISREVTDDGRSMGRINSAIVPLALLREISDYIINIHGQHDNQALLMPSRHIDFLDKFAKDEDLKADYRESYNEYRRIQREIEVLSVGEREREQKIDLLTYQTNEIENAKLKIGEYEELIEQRDIIANAEKISTAVEDAYENLYDMGDMQSAYDGISNAAEAIGKIKDIDSNLADIYNRLNDAMYSIDDIAHEIKEYGNGVEYDERVLNDIESRLELISNLKRKYGSTVEEILEFYEKAKAELDNISDSDNKIMQLEKEKEAVQKQIAEKAQKLSDTRKEAGCQIQRLIKDALHELDMPNAEFAVNIDRSDDYSPNGADTVEFLISNNVGEPLKPLVKVASGGELSRVMLAVKSILADDVDTLIFDEIDTGVSGSAARKIAAKLSQIADGKQVICITHLAALAAMADNHYLIKKEVADGKTTTGLTELNDSERERELARIIDGSNITETALSHAKEMLKSGYLEHKMKN